MITKNDSEIIQDWDHIDNEDIKVVCEILRKHTKNISDYLVALVASLCGVEVKDMMTRTDKINIVHSRWLYWYAYRYMSGEAYGSMRERMSEWGRGFTEQSISDSVNKMGAMITQSNTWAKRWSILKKIIKLREEANKEESKAQYKISITIPKDLKNKVEIEYKD